MISIAQNLIIKVSFEFFCITADFLSLNNYMCSEIHEIKMSVTYT